MAQTPPPTIKAIIARELRRARRPLPVAEIHHRSTRIDPTIAHKSLGAILSAETSKPDGMFVRVERGVYTLRSKT
jgi:hypothetical protein